MPQSSTAGPENGGRAAYDGANRRKGAKVHMTVDTLGYLLSPHVMPADVQDRARVAELVEPCNRRRSNPLAETAPERFIVPHQYTLQPP